MINRVPKIINSFKKFISEDSMENYRNFTGDIRKLLKLKEHQISSELLKYRKDKDFEHLLEAVDDHIQIQKLIGEDGSVLLSNMFAIPFDIYFRNEEIGSTIDNDEVFLNITNAFQKFGFKKENDTIVVSPDLYPLQDFVSLGKEDNYPILKVKRIHQELIDSVKGANFDKNKIIKEINFPQEMSDKELRKGLSYIKSFAIYGVYLSKEHNFSEVMNADEDKVLELTEYIKKELMNLYGNTVQIGISSPNHFIDAVKNHIIVSISGMIHAKLLELSNDKEKIRVNIEYREIQKTHTIKVDVIEKTSNNSLESQVFAFPVWTSIDNVKAVLKHVENLVSLD